MRQLLVTFAVALSGCPLASDELEDSRGGSQALTIHWTIKMPGGAPAPCPAGFDQLLLSSTTVEREGQVQTLVPCQTSGSQTVELFTSGERRFHMEGQGDAVFVERFSPNYEHIIYVTDPTGFVERARSLPVRITLDGDQTVAVEIYPDAGFLLQSWGLRSGITGARVLTCPAVAVDEVELRYRLFTFAGEPEAPAASVRWPCDERHEEYFPSDEAVGQGFAPALAPEDYVGSLIGYRGGVEVVRNDDVTFTIQTGGLLTEAEDDLTVADR